MFRQSVYETALTTETADGYFSRIRGCTISSDITFLATLRALIFPRLPEDETLTLEFSTFRSTLTNEIVERISDNKDAIDRIFDSWERNSNSIHILNIRSRGDDSFKRVAGVIGERFCAVNPGFHIIDKITEFYKNSFGVICLANEETKQVVVVVDSINMQILHYLQVAILAMLPWYFDPKKGITADEKGLLDSLTDKSPDRYIRCIEKISQGYDLASYRVRTVLSGFEKNFEKVKLEDEIRVVNRIDEEIRNLNGKYAELNRRRKDATISILGLRASIAEEASEDSLLMGYFLCNKHLFLNSARDTRIRFSVKDQITYFDEEAAERYIGNKNGYLYSACNSSTISKSDFEKLLRAIFLEETLKVNVCASYEIDLRGSVSAIRRAEFNTIGLGFLDCMPNPHIDEYRCMGGYERKINEALIESNYIGAIEQCIASTKSLNIIDSVVMEEFASVLCGNSNKNNRCIVLPDGSVVRPTAAIEWLKNGEIKNEEGAEG